MKAPKKQTIETVKTVLIAVLVTAILAFVAGIHYADSQHSRVDAAVSAVSTEAPAKAPTKK